MRIEKGSLGFVMILTILLLLVVIVVEGCSGQRQTYFLNYSPEELERQRIEDKDFLRIKKETNKECSFLGSRLLVIRFQ